MINESHEVQNKQLEALKKDTEAQLHDVCSMIEEFGTMIKSSESRLSALSKIETKQTETEKLMKEILVKSDKQVAFLKVRADDLIKKHDLTVEKVSQQNKILQTHEDLLCKLEKSIKTAVQRPEQPMRPEHIPAAAADFMSASQPSTIPIVRIGRHLTQEEVI